MKPDGAIQFASLRRSATSFSPKSRSHSCQFLNPFSLALARNAEKIVSPTPHFAGDPVPDFFASALAFDKGLRVVEDADAFFKRDAFLPLVSSIFLVVPFEVIEDAFSPRTFGSFKSKLKRWLVQRARRLG